ncbi:hypothetical protein DWX61_02195 [Ruminococcus sp. AF20-12LB]|nr:hypothetical protein DWX61_02195 [Ruminococcus sp. AF20-12LB]
MSSWDFFDFVSLRTFPGRWIFLRYLEKNIPFYNFTRVNKYSCTTKQNFRLSCRHGLIYTRFYKYARDNLKNMKKILHKNASESRRYYKKIQEKQKRP